MAKEIDSDSLIASSNDSLNDCISTASVIIGLILFKLFNIVWIDSAIGILVAVFIVISGIKMIFETINPLIGSMPSQEEIDKISKKILSYGGVLGIHDLVIHCYGACTIFASVHIEVDAKVDIMESHDMIDNIEKAVKNELNVNLTAHLDPIDVGNPETLRLKAIVLDIVQKISTEISIHDFRVVHGTTHTNILFDVAIPCKFQYSPDELRNMINNEIHKIGDNYIAIINVDQLYVTSVEKTSITLVQTVDKQKFVNSIFYYLLNLGKISIFMHGTIKNDYFYSFYNKNAFKMKNKVLIFGINKNRTLSTN